MLKTFCLCFPLRLSLFLYRWPFYSFWLIHCFSSTIQWDNEWQTVLDRMKEGAMNKNKRQWTDDKLRGRKRQTSWLTCKYFPVEVAVPCDSDPVIWARAEEWDSLSCWAERRDCCHDSQEHRPRHTGGEWIIPIIAALVLGEIYICRDDCGQIFSYLAGIFSLMGFRLLATENKQLEDVTFPFL